MGVIEERVFLVDLAQPMNGYRRFLSAWIYEKSDFCACIDCGPTSSIPLLIRRLRAEGIDRLDLVLLTHIHLDHGGGVGHLLRKYPEARVWCHPRGREHLVNPERLWKGSVTTIGKVAESYGEPLPVPRENLATDEQLESLGVQAVPTPGHAPHHASFVIGEWLFAGEAVATRMRLPRGREYLRPATPPRFLPEVFLDSLRVLEELEPRPRRLAFAHYGVAENERCWYARARRQLELWMDVVRRWWERGKFDSKGMIEEIERLDEHFLLGDLPPDIAERERFYVTNSLKGMWRYFDEKASR